MLHRPERLAFLASGTGSNVRAILTAIREKRLGCRAVCLLSDRAKAPALELARAAGLETAVFGRACWGDHAPRADDVLDWLRGQAVDSLVLAGFLRKVPAVLLEAWPGAIYNIHPALLPSFGGPGMYGSHVHRAVWNAGCRVSGATVHLVDGIYDHGTILAQASTDLEGASGPDEVAARVLAVEHRLFADTLERLHRGTLTVRKESPLHG
ncbi:MAG: phosphoribosylglycinamide formyltransferase [Candidatus Cloacimonetes bacterium]|nr:phosphoribosylglycinamide formyltransferase [Candidatus Cloacimonadota bacterium]